MGNKEIGKEIINIEIEIEMGEIILGKGLSVEIIVIANLAL